MRVIHLASGQTGTIPDASFDPKIYKSLEATPVKSGGISQYAPLIGQILGGIAGGALTLNPVGAVAGAGIGGAAGEGIRQKVAGEDSNIGKMATEGLWGAGSELTGLGIAKLGGKLLSGAAPKLAEKVIGSSPTEIKNAVKLLNKTPGEIATTEGLITRNPSVVSKALEPINEAYSSLVGKETTQIAKKDLVDSLLTKAAELEKSALPATKAKGNTLREIATNISNDYEDIITGKPLQQLKIELGETAGENRFLMGKKNAYKLGEDTTRSKLYEAAGDSTTPIMSGGKLVEATLPEVGKKQQELMLLEKILGRTSGKQVGAELLGLGALGRGGAGGGGAALLSVLGGERDPWAIARNAALGAGLGQVANNPKALGLLVKGMAGGGKSLTEAATMTAGSKAPVLLTLLSQATGQGLQSVVQPQANEGIAQTQSSQQISPNQSEDQTQNKANQNMISHNPIISSGGQWMWDSTQNDWVPNKTQATATNLDGDKIKQLMVMDLIQTGGKNLTKLETLNKIFGSSGKPMTAGQKKELSDYEVSQQLMTNLIPEIESASKKGIMGPISGRARVINPYDTDVQTFNSNIKAAAQVVGRAMEGGVLRKEDIPKYEAMLPNVTDTREVALGKIKNVARMLEMQRKTKESSYSSSENLNDGTDVLQSILSQ